MNKKDYPYSYDTKNEEFFYRWGLAALFHDVGYPVEIVGRQINRLIDFATDVEGAGEKVNVQLLFSNFDELNRIHEVIPNAGLPNATGAVMKTAFILICSSLSTYSRMSSISLWM